MKNDCPTHKRAPKGVPAAKPGETMMMRTLRQRQQSARAALDAELRNLAQRVDSAREALAKGGAMDEHLIVNASSISAHIARWNLLRDLIPYAEEP